ncbi:putative guanylate kinase [Leptotrichia hofstadii F0254]|uniref:Putative guanylate kinase n=1 Tax=Leptotrichia hofstadii F0254 TaxID=634994 RepID=C9MZ06_9FUSO|nr:putative guanylate kinase [Leptotrichia hofstadii F0254]
MVFYERKTIHCFRTFRFRKINSHKISKRQTEYPVINISYNSTAKRWRNRWQRLLFLTKEIFEQKIKNDEFYEYANVHGNYYGTLKEVVESNLNKGLNVILEIDVQGALIAKEKKKDAVLVFFRTKDMETLEKRLRDRKTDTEEVIQTRLKNALKELEYEKKYDYTIINDDIEMSCQELINIINS